RHRRAHSGSGGRSRLRGAQRPLRLAVPFDGATARDGPRTAWAPAVYGEARAEGPAISAAPESRLAGLALRSADHRTPPRWRRRTGDRADSPTPVRRRSSPGRRHVGATRGASQDAEAAAGSILPSATRARRGGGVTAPFGAPLVQSR